MSQVETEKCVLCNNDTGVPVSTHVDYRSFYVEGAGQLCKKCYESTNDRDLVTVPRSYFKLYPNNYDLGEKLRGYYHQNY